MRKSHECHSEPQAKNLALPATYEGEILRLSPQDDIATQSVQRVSNKTLSRNLSIDPNLISVFVSWHSVCH
jgi:hypothetical protein